MDEHLDGHHTSLEVEHKVVWAGQAVCQHIVQLQLGKTLAPLTQKHYCSVRGVTSLLQAELPWQYTSCACKAMPAQAAAVTQLGSGWG